MRILKSYKQHWLAGITVAILTLSASGFGGSVAFADSPLSPAAQSKIIDTGSAWTAALATAGKKLPIIVEFAMPAIPDQPASASEADRDSAHVAAVRSAQEGILSRALGVSGTQSISSAQSSGDVNLKLMPFSPQFAMNASAQEIEKLASDPTVIKIYEDQLAAPLLDQSVPLIGMTTAYAQGATGNGYRVAVLDTGGRRGHEFLSSRIDNEACFNTTNSSQGSTSRCPGGASSSTVTGSGEDCNSTPIYGCGHGTHVAGTAAGFNTNRQAGEPANGVARDGRILAVNVFSQFTLSQCGSVPSGSTGCVLSWQSDQIAALNYVNSVRSTQSIASVNMSLGGGQYFSACDSSAPQTSIINTLRANNVAVVIAAGNDGFDDSVGSPGCISGAITVGSSTKSDVRSSFSNWGPLIDVVAPGSSIYASYTNNGNIGYASLNGTSMATPHVAGAWAALRSAVPSATVSQIETALENTGLPVSSASTTKPRIRVDQALAALGGGSGSARIVAAITPVARSTQFGTNPSTGQPFYVTAFASVTNAGTSNATGCTIAKPADGLPYSLIYAQRLPPNLTSLGPTSAPFDLAPGDANAKHFLLVLTPSAAMSSNIRVVFDCNNTDPAPTYLGVNSFQLTASASPTPDVIATVGTPNDGGIIAIQPGGGRVVAMAAMNIAQTGAVTARLSTTPIGGSTINLPLTLGLCRTNPSTGVCMASPTTLPINFTANKDEVNTFTAFINHSGADIPWDPGTNRVYIQFFNGSSPIGAASIAIYTSTSAPNTTASLD